MTGMQWQDIDSIIGITVVGSEKLAGILEHKVSEQMHKSNEERR
jgi:hypothetical protein